MTSDEHLHALVRRNWGLTGKLSPIDIGISSNTWRLGTDAGTFVVKTVFVDDDHFVAGLSVSAALGQLDIRSGAPVPTSGDELHVADGDTMIAVLRYEPGRPIDLTRPQEVRAAGQLLGTVHTLQRQVATPPTLPSTLESVFTGPHLELDSRLAPLAQELQTALQSLPPLETGIRHGDVDPVEFLIGRPSEGMALVDWGSVQTGPLLLDVAQFAVIGHANDVELAEFVAGYRSARQVAGSEVAALPVMQRIAWLQQVAFFGNRVMNETGDSREAQQLDSYGLERSLEILLTGIWRP